MRQSTYYYCSDSSLHGCTNERIGRITHFSVYILFVCAVGAVLLPTVTSSMPEKSGFAIVEKYGDSAKAVRRLCTCAQIGVPVLVAARGARTDMLLLHRRLSLRHIDDDDFAIRPSLTSPTSTAHTAICE